jgi:hypothetical protein
MKRTHGGKPLQLVRAGMGTTELGWAGFTSRLGREEVAQNVNEFLFPFFSTAQPQNPPKEQLRSIFKK